MESFVGSLQEAPVWEITGAEFSKSEMHTADGISIRFPRMTRIRDDKDWKSATNLHQLKVAFPQPRLLWLPVQVARCTLDADGCFSDRNSSVYPKRTVTSR